jgi:hypothetical protein
LLFFICVRTEIWERTTRGESSSIILQYYIIIVHSCTMCNVCR